VLKTVDEGTAFCRENGCDFLVALGGGSCIDTAKAISVLMTNEGQLWDYITGGSGLGKPILNETMPVITIPTTAGTGSEVGVGLVITKEDTNEKGSVKVNSLFPRYCFADMELQSSVPAKLTAFQGYDALTHCMEGYTNLRAGHMTDMYALTGIEHASQYLPRAVKNGKDLKAREHVGFCAVLTGTSMALSGTSSMHALEHAMSGYHGNLPHGAGLIMLAHAWFKRNVDVHACDDRFIQMAKAMGKEDASKASDFIDLLDKFISDIGCSELKMSDYGITPDEFEKFDENARFVVGGLFGVDRVPFTKEDVVNVFTKSYK
jgi:alcohol dehydrogenase